MAINFPSSPTEGEEYTDANSGTWVYDSGTNSWTLVAGGTTSAFNFRGGHDFRSSTPPTSPINSGDMWIHDAPTGTIDSVYTGISGQIGNGQLVLWDGNSYVMVSGIVPGYPDVGDGEGGTLDSRYLKLGANAGAQTVATTQLTKFNGLVEASSGVKVTGGDAASVDTGLYQSAVGGIQFLHLATNGDEGVAVGSFLDPSITTQVINLSGTTSVRTHVIGANYDGTISSQLVALPEVINKGNQARVTGVGCSFSQASLVGYSADDLNSLSSYLADNNDITSDAYQVSAAFHSLNSIDATHNNRFGFYSTGNAPNYFEGELNLQSIRGMRIGQYGAQGGVATIENPWEDTWTTDNTHDVCTQTVGGMVHSRLCTFNGADDVGASFLLNNRHATANKTTYVSFRENGTTVGSINSDGGGQIEIIGTSDYRVKENVVPLSSAVDTIKALNPCSFNFIGRSKTVKGFIAHELETAVPEAVSGTKDATEAIGTLADYDGTVLETEVTEPSELTYTEDVTDEYGVSTQAIRTRTWTSTGTRPVYQGVDQTKLIPLLTKALQEALERIEALEAAATNGGY